jgi:hypothetical protein
MVRKSGRRVNLRGTQGTIIDTEEAAAYTALSRGRMRFAKAVLCAMVILTAGCGPATITKSGRAPANPATAVAGVWKAHEVAYAPWTFDLHIQGQTVSGSVKQERFHDARRSRVTSLTAPVPIYGGMIQGDEITFQCKTPGGDRTVTFTGEIRGDEIRFRREVQVAPRGNPGEDGIFGASGAKEFVATKASSSE